MNNSILRITDINKRGKLATIDPKGDYASAGPNQVPTGRLKCRPALQLTNSINKTGKTMLRTLNNRTFRLPENGGVLNMKLTGQIML